MGLANAIARALPHEAKGYIYVASSPQELGRANEAFAVLLQEVELFPEDEIILSDLARVCCSLGRVEDARRWRGRDIDVGRDEIKRRAMKDLDLGQVWAPGDGDDAVEGNHLQPETDYR